MLKNRALEVRLVKSSPDDTTEQIEVKTIDAEEINRIVKEQVVHTAVVVAALIGGAKLLSTVCDIAVHTAKVKIK